MKKKKIIISIVIVLTVIFSIIVGWLLNEVFGNPVSKFLAKRGITEYLEENYSDSDFVIEKVGYDFKNMEYYAKVVSASDSDKYFYIDSDSVGKNIDDNYDAYFDENGQYTDDVETTEEDVTEDKSNEEKKNYIDSSEKIEYQGPFWLTKNPDGCNNKFFIYDKDMMSSDKKATYLFGITYTDEQSKQTDTVAVISADYDAQYGVSFLNAEIIASNQESVIFEVGYPPTYDTFSYLYNMKTDELMALQEDHLSGHIWYVFDDMFLCTTQTLAVGMQCTLYAYNWDGDLLYAYENILAGYTVIDGWVYFADEVVISEDEKLCTAYRMKLDGTEKTEVYSVNLPEGTDFVVLDDGKAHWWENGEEKVYNLHTSVN